VNFVQAPGTWFWTRSAWASTRLGIGNRTPCLVADSGNVNPTPAYYVFRHLSQYVVPGATVVGTTGGDAVAFKNSDGSIVAVVYNSGAENKKLHRRHWH